MLTRYEREVLYIAAMKEGVSEFCRRVGLPEREFWKLVRSGVSLNESIVREKWHEILKVLDARDEVKRK